VHRLGLALLLALGAATGCVEDVPTRTLKSWTLEVGETHAPVELPAHLGHGLDEREGDYALRTRVALDPDWRGQNLTLTIPVQRTVFELRVDGRRVPYLDEHPFDRFRIMSAHRFRIDGALTDRAEIDLELRGHVALAEASWWDLAPTLARGPFGDRWTRIMNGWNQATAWISLIALATLAIIFWMLHLHAFLRHAHNSETDNKNTEFAKLAGGAALYPAVQLGLLQPLLGRRDIGLLAIAVLVTAKASVSLARKLVGLPPLPRWTWWAMFLLTPIVLVASGGFIGRSAGIAWIVFVAVVIAVIGLETMLRAVGSVARSDLRWMVALWGLACLGGLPDMLRAAGWGVYLGGVQLTCAALLVFVDVQAWMMSRDHTELLLRQGALNRELEGRVREVEALNEELRRKVGDRSRELSVALRKLRVEGDVELATGTVLGDRYRVVTPLGAGAMGAVYRVERLSDGRSLAAKVVRGRVRPDTLERFTREAELTARVDHPNVVRVFDVDVTSDGELFLVMELVDGRSLEDERARFGDRAFAHAVVAQIAGALQAIHSCGIVHRDLKPANVLVSMTDGPRIKVADFGIAGLGASPSGPDASAGATTRRALAEDDAALEPTVDAPTSHSDKYARLTATGAILGTPLYMAPEVLHGTATIGPEVDLFSLGLIAYQLFGGPPIEREGSGFRSKTLLKFAELAPDLSAELAEALQHCLHQDPTRRPTAQQLVELFGGTSARAAG
jgi:serine/threonine-protein kinase